MDLIGDEGEPSPRLKDITIDDPKGVFDDLLEILSVCWQTGNLVHSDFSEYNILWYDGEPWIIDFGQAVVSAHPSSNEFLVRDVTRLVEWINRQDTRSISQIHCLEFLRNRFQLILRSQAGIKTRGRVARLRGTASPHTQRPHSGANRQGRRHSQDD